MKHVGKSRGSRGRATKNQRQDITVLDFTEVCEVDNVLSRIMHPPHQSDVVFLQITDDFIDDLVSSACKVAKLRSSVALELRDLQLLLERQHNIRIPGFPPDEFRTARRVHPAPGWAETIRAVEAGRLTGGAKG